MDGIKDITGSNIEIHVFCLGYMNNIPLFSGEKLCQYSLHTLLTLLDILVLQKVQRKVKEDLDK